MVSLPPTSRTPNLAGPLATPRTRSSLLLVLACLFSASTASAQGALQWVAPNGGDYDEYSEDHYTPGPAIALDSAGNVVAAKELLESESVDLDPGPGQFIVGRTDLGRPFSAVYKLDSNGNFMWGKGFEGTYYLTIAVGPDDNVYVVGKLEGILTDHTGQEIELPTHNDREGVVILKFDPNGDLVWARAFGDDSNDGFFDPTTDMVDDHHVAVDSAGNVYVAGRFFQSVDFDPGPGTAFLTAYDNGEPHWADADMYMAKLDANGEFVWAKPFLGPHPRNRITTLRIDDQGYPYLSGIFFMSVDFDPGRGSRILTAEVSPDDDPTGMWDAFILKLAPSSALQWVNTLGSSDASRLYVSNREGWAESLYFDLTPNHIYAAGLFRDRVDFDPGPGVDERTAQGYDQYLWKLDHDGNHVWVRSFNGTVAQPRVGPNGNIYLAGALFLGPHDVDPGPGEFLLTAETRRTTLAAMSVGAFLVFDGDGSFVSAQIMGGPWYSSVGDFEFDEIGNLYVAGVYNTEIDDVDLDPSRSIYTPPTFGRQDDFVMKFAPDLPPADPNYLHVDFNFQSSGNGSYDYPFRTLSNPHSAALTFANPGAILEIEPGASPESSITISAPVTLINANPGAGPVRIGAQQLKAASGPATGFVAAP